MIVEYHRPETIEAALQLLSRKKPITVPLGGGTVLNQPSPNPVAVVDLQSLGLNNIERKGKTLIIGATATFQQILNVKDLYPALRKAICHEATYNTRQVATIAGGLVAADGRSPITTAMLALGTQLIFQPGDEKVPLGDFLPLRKDFLLGQLVSHVLLPGDLKLAYEYVPAVIGYVLGARFAANVLPKFKFVGVAVAVALARYSTHPNVATNSISSSCFFIFLMSIQKFS